MTSARPSVHDVVIVGAGPAGSATAAVLSAHGARVALLDRARFPRSKPCAEYVNPVAVELLERLGVLASLRSFGPPELGGMRIVSPSGVEFVGRFAGRGPGLAIRRTILDHALVRAAVERGTELIEGAHVVGLDSMVNGTRAVAVRSHGRTRLIHGRLVVGADGLNSRIATAMTTVRRGRLRRLALVGHARDVRRMRALGEMHVRPWGYVGLAPLDASLVNVSVVVDVDRTPRRHATVAAWFRAMLAAVPEVSERLRSARFVTPIRAVGPFARSTTTAVGDRVLLVGDAADFYDPFTGEGIHAALRDAQLVTALLLDDRLERDRLRREQLAGYDASRRRAFGPKRLVERLIAYVVGHPSLMDHVAPRLAGRPELADRLVQVTGALAPASDILRPSFVWGLLR